MYTILSDVTNRAATQRTRVFYRTHTKCVHYNEINILIIDVANQSTDYLWLHVEAPSGTIVI